MSDVQESVVPAAAPAVPAPPAVPTEQSLSVDERLVLKEIENEYLKAQLQIQAFSQTTQNAQKRFTSTIEALTKKYAINPALMVFDNVELKFKALPKNQ